MDAGNRRNDPDTHIGGGAARFPATSWTVLLSCRDREGPAARESLNRLISLYWKPVYCMIRRGGARSNEDAKDLCQEFFARVVLEGPLVERYAPARGSFRAFLKAALRNFLGGEARDGRAQKRGGDVVVASLDGSGADVLGFLADPAAGPEEVFDRAWEGVVLAQAIRGLEDRLRAGGQEVAWEIFRAYELAPEGDRATYEILGERFHLAPHVVKHHLARARQELLESLRRIVVEYVDSPEDLAGEMRGLLGG